MGRLAFAVSGAILSGLAAGAAAIPAARAEMQVLESNASAFPVGSKLPDDTQFNLQPGERVQVLLPSNRTKLFEGPKGKAQRPIGATRGGIKKPPAGE